MSEYEYTHFMIRWRPNAAIRKESACGPNR